MAIKWLANWLREKVADNEWNCIYCGKHNILPKKYEKRCRYCKWLDRSEYNAD